MRNASVFLGLLAAMLLALLSSGLSPARAQLDALDNGRKVESTLVADFAVVAPGQDFHLGLHQIIAEHWHTYWRNPGDAGLPAQISWTLPEGVEAGEIIWPAPEKLPVDPIMDYGYKNEVLFPIPFSLSEDFAGDRIEIGADIFYLVCEEICIPEDVSLTFALPVGEASSPSPLGQALLEEAFARVPQMAEGATGVLLADGGEMVLELVGDFLAEAQSWRDIYFFPHEQGLIEHAADQGAEAFEGVLQIRLQPGFLVENGLEGEQAGLISFERPDGEGGWVRERWEVRAETLLPAGAFAAGATGAAGSAPGSGSGGPDGIVMQTPPSMALILVFAFLGGLILNLMPCVFPVLSIKALTFVDKAHKSPGEVRAQGVFFLLGVLASFVALAALLVILRNVGLPVGWGFQLQTPFVVALLALLFFAIGLNLLGMFEIGTSLQGVGSGLAGQGGVRGAFFTGVLAVVVAAPCVGPFAAGALGAALTQPAYVVILVSAMMGLGLAAPFMALALAPSLLRFLPKPGPWMDTFKQFLAFPMFGSALWLLWVLTTQAGPAGVLWTGIAALALTFAIWSGKRGAVVWKGAALVSAALMVGSVVLLARAPVQSGAMVAEVGVETWSPDAVALAREEGRPVFIDVTAAWCVTCQFNKQTTLARSDVRRAMADLNVAFMRADWTNRDDSITALITEHGQAGVPLYLVYPADGGPAEVLPPLLTRDIVIDALEAAAR